MDFTSDNVLNVYRFGSHVYGTNNATSDEDFIVVVKDWVESNDINIHVFTQEQFQSALNRCDIQALECFYLDKQYILKETHKFSHNLDKFALRIEISTVSSNSYVKGKKKLIVSADYDLNLAIKSVFHSLRILDFGIQLASDGKISNYSSMNWVLSDLRNLSNQYQRDELWAKIDEKYKKIFNSKSSEFKQLAPKDLVERDKKNQLITLLKFNGIENNINLVDEILMLFK